MSEKIKFNIITKTKFPNEAAIIPEIIDIVPHGSNIFIGNSIPVRDLDNFASTNSKMLNIHFNRGASGIDGITSTSLGLAARRKPTVLITGDLSFLHDLNALGIAMKYSIPLIIIVINNNGGGIFESLPIANKIKEFKEYFITPHNLHLDKIVKSFGINYHFAKNRYKFRMHFSVSIKKNLPTVIEIKTDAKKAVALREKYFNEVKKKNKKRF